ncbi:MAG: hypothetical protein LC122_06745 [Chitinophagales bacterium]|nr:hypothetical protein [Chitinophagales bacterium]
MKTKRKNITSLFIFLFYICLFNYVLYSQTYDSTPLDQQELERYYDQNNNLKYDKDYPGSTDNFAYVGKNATSSETKNTFRMIYTWVHSIPATATITSCTLYIAQTVTSNAPSDDPTYVEF